MMMPCCRTAVVIIKKRQHSDYLGIAVYNRVTGGAFLVHSSSAQHFCGLYSSIFFTNILITDRVRVNSSINGFSVGICRYAYLHIMSAERVESQFGCWGSRSKPSMTPSPDRPASTFLYHLSPCIMADSFFFLYLTNISSCATVCISWK